MAATPGTVTTAANPNSTSNTSLTVTLATTTVGELNVIEISGLATGTTVNPGMATPAGWTKLLERMDTNGTPAAFVAVYYRTYQAGDPSTVTIAWTNPGQMVAICTPWTEFDPANPIPWSASDFKVTSDANYSIASTTTAAGILAYGFANRTGTAWSNLSDVDRGQVGLASSATMVARNTAAEVASGTGFTKTATGSNTSVGVSWAYVVAAGSQIVPGTAALTGTGALDAAGTPAAADTAGLTGSGALSGSPATPVDLWIARTPMYVAHRGGSADWPECTAYAYSKAVAWGCDALEVPVWRSSDGVWVASHNRSTLAVTGVDKDIPSTTWADLSALRTTNGGWPLARLGDILDAYAGDHVIFVENKQDTNMGVFLDFLDAHGGPRQIVVKYFCNAATGPSPGLSRARGYRAWGYYYQGDVPSLPTTAAAYELLGMDYTADQASWNAALSYGKPVLGHIIDSAAAATTAFGKGASGLMTAKVTQVIPPHVSTTAALTGAGTLSTAGAPTIPVTVWDGTSEHPATGLGWWDGAAEHAASGIEVTA